MPPSYLSLTVELPEADSELAQMTLHEAGALGLEVRDSEAPPLPGVRPPTPGEALIVAYFEDRSSADGACAELSVRWPWARTELAAVESQDWSQSWKALIRSVQTERLWVGPPWMTSEAPSGLTQVVIEPKMAFGTGDHPTTFLCLKAVDTFMAQNPSASVLDVGTGTGVLAIAARKLGASRAVGIDNDPLSVILAEENGTSNGTPEVELSGQTLDSVGGPFDLVVANILANTLMAMAPELAPKVGRRLILAGVLVPQRDAVESAYRAEGLMPDGVEIQGEWIRLDFRRGS